MPKIRPVKVTAPQTLAMRSCLRDPSRGVTGHHDGMALKACRGRGWLDDSNHLTELGRAVLIRHDEVARNAFILDGEFTRWAGFGLDANRYIQRACLNWCGDQHETWTRDELGNPVQTEHHRTPMACLVALAEAGITPRQVSLRFS